MPLYEYEIEETGEVVELFQKNTAKLTKHPETGAKMKRLVSRFNPERQWHGKESRSLAWGLPTEKARRRALENGEDIDFDDSGAAIFRNDSHHRRFLKSKAEERRVEEEKAAEGEDKAVRAGLIEKEPAADTSDKKAIQAVERVLAKAPRSKK